ETLLVTGTAREWCQRRTGTNEERPDALRGMELVADQRQEVHAQVIHANGDLPDRLSGVAVDERPGRGPRLGDVGDRLHDARLAVRVHDRDERRVRAHRSAHLLDAHTSPGVDVGAREAPALPLQPRAYL